MGKLSRLDNKIIVFASMLSNVYKNEEDYEAISKLELSDETLTEDFTAMLYGMYVLYSKIADDDTDIIGFTHILNRLAFQNLMSKEED